MDRASRSRACGSRTDREDRTWIARIVSGSRGSRGSHVDCVDRADQGLDPNGYISEGIPYGTKIRSSVNI
eukprot:scaffold32_cov120-Isochrysis_galbana.AAC.5